MYNWEKKDWPHFSYTLDHLDDDLLAIASEMGQVTGVMEALPEDVQTEAIIDMMVAEAIKTSEIEGEYLDREDVNSSIRKNLGLKYDPRKVKDLRVEGVSKLMVDVRENYQKKLTKTTLCSWHKMLMMGNQEVIVGDWRKNTDDDPMQVISGPYGKRKIHFEALPSGRVPEEMATFITWFNETGPKGSQEIKKAPVRAAIVHLYFESIHPFEDGNGRIGRALSEKALSQGIGRPVMISLARTIEANKKAYYKALQAAQQSNEITPWITYFVKTIQSAQNEAKAWIDFTLKKTRFFDRFKDQLNDRQLKVVKRMLDAGPNGFEGGMNASKYQSLTKISKATATRDLAELLEMGVLRLMEGRGRSTRYEVKL